jgi:hypothetical protein
LPESRHADAELRFAFTLDNNSGEVDVYRSNTDTKNALAIGKAFLEGNGINIDDSVFVRRNVILGFEKTPTAEEKRQVEAWLRTE